MLAPRFKVSLKIWSIKKSRAFFHWIKWVLEVSKQRGKVRVTNGLLLFLNRQLEVVYWQLKMEPINDIKRRPEERCKRRNSNCFMYVPFFHEQSGQFWLCSSCTSDHKLYNASKQPTSLINIDSPPMSFPKNIIPLHAHSINLQHAYLCKICFTFDASMTISFISKNPYEFAQQFFPIHPNTYTNMKI